MTYASKQEGFCTALNSGPKTFSSHSALLFGPEVRGTNTAPARPF